MGTYYAENNNESTIDLFDKRRVYSGRMQFFQRQYKNIVDFNFAEKQFYGRVDRQFIPRVLRNSGRILLKDIGNGQTGTIPHQAVNFVVDAFKDLQQQFNKCAMLGKINTEDPYLTTLKVYNAYSDPMVLHGASTQSLQNSIRAYIQAAAIPFKNFDEFMVQLDSYWDQQEMTVPYTLPGFVKSRYCPIMASGLAIEIADLDPNNDQEKIDMFVNSKNWSFYVNACRSYGFMVDKNIPWRLVADIGPDSAMMPYAARYQIYGTDQILTMGYTYAHNRYFNNFKINLLLLYNLTKLKNYTETEMCTDGSMVTNIITPQSYTLSDFQRLYSDVYIIKKYLNLRFKEEESTFTASDIHLLVDDVEELYNVYGLNRALTLIERILNKPFDYRGSWTYIKARREALHDLSDA